MKNGLIFICILVAGQVVAAYTAFWLGLGLKRFLPSLADEWWAWMIVGLVMLAVGIGFILGAMRLVGMWLSRWKA